jgi:phosphatidylglycerophosphatase A
MRAKAAAKAMAKTVNEKERSLAARIALLIATVGGLGSFPVAPGTVGAGVGVGVVVLVGQLLATSALARMLLAAAAVGIFFLGVWTSGIAERELATEDPGCVIIDEVSGQIIAFLVHPVASWSWLIGGFLLFRFFDVLKPFPARRAEHLPRGWGIMTDDVLAGAYSALALFLIGFAVR